MQSIPDNTALRAHLESQVNLINEVAQKTLDTLRQIGDINLTLARQTAEASIYASREIIGSSDPMQLSQTMMRQLQPAAERLRNYQQHLLAVLSSAQTGFTQTAESRIPEASRRATAAADEMARHATAAVSVPVTGPGTQPQQGEETTPEARPNLH